MSLLAIILVLLLFVVLVMPIRDGRPFFGDYLRVAVLLLALVSSVLVWLPFPHR